MAAIFAELEFPEEKFSIRYRKAVLRPFIEKAFAGGLTPRDLFSALKGTTINLPSQDFFPLVNRRYERLEKATAIQTLPGDQGFYITQLPQDHFAIPDRFVSKLELVVTKEDGTSEIIRRTYGFGEKMTKDDLINEAEDYFDECPSPPCGKYQVRKVLELWKQY